MIDRKKQGKKDRRQVCVIEQIEKSVQKGGRKSVCDSLWRYEW